METTLRHKTFAAFLIAATLSSGMAVSAQAQEVPRTTSTSSVSASSTQAVSNSIGWGIKDSFNSYIGGPFKLDGVTYTNGSYSFPTTSVKRTETSVEIKGSGSVQFIGHCDTATTPLDDCPLNLTFSNPRIVINPSGESAIYMTVRTKNYTSKQWEGPAEVKMATISTDGASQTTQDGVTIWSKLATNLTDEGNHAFSNFYTTGVGMSSLNFSYKGEPISTAKQDYTIGDSYNTGAAYNGVNKTFEVAGKVLEVSKIGDNKARLTLLDPSNMKAMSTTDLPVNNYLSVVVNKDTQEVVLYNTETKKFEKYGIENKSLVKKSDLPFTLPSDDRNVMALGYNPVTRQYAALTLNNAASGAGEMTYFTDQAVLKTASLPDPLTVSPLLKAAKAEGKDFETVEYFGESYNTDGRVLEALPDGSFLYSPGTNISDAGLYDHLVQFKNDGSVTEVKASLGQGETHSLRNLKIGSNGYIYRWNTFWKDSAAVQVLKFDGKNFSVVREVGIPMDNLSEISGIYFDGTYTVATDTTNGRVVWFDENFKKVREISLANMRKTNRENPTLLGMNNGDIIVPTMIENPTTYDEELWLTRLVKTQPKVEIQLPSTAPNEPEKPVFALKQFVDVPGNHIFYKEITWLGSVGISRGWDDGTFRPFENVDRASTAAFFYRMAGSPDYTPPVVSPFSDVPTTHPFYKEISWLASRGITTGYPDGTFRPQETANRDAIAAFFYRYAGKPDYTAPANSPFTDLAPTDLFYKEISWLKSKGITKGWDDGTFRPMTPVKRDAVAAFIYRYDNLG